MKSNSFIGLNTIKEQVEFMRKIIKKEKQKVKVYKKRKQEENDEKQTQPIDRP